jgi:hypothetical protein
MSIASCSFVASPQRLKGFLPLEHLQSVLRVAGWSSPQTLRRVQEGRIVALALQAMPIG